MNSSLETFIFAITASPIQFIFSFVQMDVLLPIIEFISAIAAKFEFKL